MSTFGSKIEKKLTHLISESFLEKSYENFFSKLQQIKTYKNIFIYGAGGWGGELCRLLMANQIKPTAFFDRNIDKNNWRHDIAVFNPDHIDISDEDKRESLVIIATKPESHPKIKGNIVKQGFKNITTIDGIWSYGCWVKRDELINLLAETENILACAGLWEDEQSSTTYLQQISNYINRNDSKQILLAQNQYFPYDIDFCKGYSRFVDCGAYTGDTIAALVDHHGKIETLVALEPVERTFMTLSSYISSSKNEIAATIYLFPCGLWSSSKTIAFDDNKGPSSHISPSGHAVYQCVALDDILSGFGPTFIKMDIEGAELEAIKGAKHTLYKDKPDLAISVYHQIEHLWKIPLALHRLGLNYKFYLRSYEHYNQETILYAV